MPIHGIIEPLTPLWWSGVVVAVLSALIFPFAFKNRALILQNKFEKVIGISAILIYVITIILAINLGDWPFYIFFLELFVFLHIVLIYKLTPKKI